MLKDNADNKKKRTREEKKKLAVRIIALAMAALMVLGMAYYIIVFLGAAIHADDVHPETETSEILDTSSLKSSGDVLVSVGLLYGSTASPGIECVSEEGYVLGIQELDGNRRFSKLWDLDASTVTCTVDGNLEMNGRTFGVAERTRDADLGGFHVEVDCWDCDREDLEDLIDDNKRALSRMGYDLIPAWIDGYYMLRIGDFATRNEAEEALELIEEERYFNRRDLGIATPSSTAVSVLDPYNGVILFEFDGKGADELGLRAREDRNGNTYIMLSSGNVYDGVFVFRRSANGSKDAVSLTNIIPLEAYIAGVLPFETSNAWPIETQKAFAVTVRSFTLTHMRENSKHQAAYGFDLCNEVCCQVYRGAGRINDAVMDAVLGTAGKVMTYQGDIVTAYYSSSMGGVTVNAQDAWGGREDVPYLQAIETPWEDYMHHENAFWINEISPTALLERMHLAGYEQLKGSVQDLEVLEYARDSTYIKTLKVTDEYGTSVTITTTDAVRTSLTPYVKSSNFVVGRGKVEYTEDVVVNEAAKTDISAGKSGPEEYGIDYGYMDFDDYYVITAESEERTYLGDSVQILTDTGTVNYGKRDVFAITRQNAAAFENAYVISADDDTVDDMAGRFNTETVDGKSTETTKYKIAYAENPDNFIFVGKGWGHGVGMSQWGAKDLADRGYTALEILEAYFLTVDIMDYEDTNNFR